jgi:hypothetical protein
MELSDAEVFQVIAEVDAATGKMEEGKSFRRKQNA